MPPVTEPNPNMHRKQKHTMDTKQAMKTKRAGQRPGQSTPRSKDVKASPARGSKKTKGKSTTPSLAQIINGHDGCPDHAEMVRCEAALRAECTFMTAQMKVVLYSVKKAGKLHVTTFSPTPLEGYFAGKLSLHVIVTEEGCFREVTLVQLPLAVSRSEEMAIPNCGRDDIATTTDVESFCYWALVEVEAFAAVIHWMSRQETLIAGNNEFYFTQGPRTWEMEEMDAEEQEQEE